MSDTQNKNNITNPIDEDMPFAIPLMDDELEAATGGTLTNAQINDIKAQAAQEGRNERLTSFRYYFENGEPVPGTNFDCSCDLAYKYSMSVKPVYDSANRKMLILGNAKCYGCGQLRPEIHCYLSKMK